jgi:hypothetical protein
LPNQFRRDRRTFGAMPSSLKTGSMIRMVASTRGTSERICSSRSSKSSIPPASSVRFATRPERQ